MKLVYQALELSRLGSRRRFAAKERGHDAEAIVPEDALDEPNEDDETDPTLPGDLWFASRGSTARRSEKVCVVYSRLAARPGSRRALVCV